MPNEKELAFTKEFLFTCKGYDPRFIDGNTNISLQRILPSRLKGDLPTVEENENGILNYTGLSVLYSAKRKVPFVAAYNIDGASEANAAPRPSFQQDPRIDSNCQLGNDFYNLRTDITEFEIGHMASNNEMGRGEDGEMRAYQTFFFTNSVPQAERLNSGLWKTLESYIIREAATVDSNKRISVFSGPVLTDKDPGYIKMPSFKIPLLFFKVIVFQAGESLFSTAFMMSHEKKLIEDNMLVTPPPKRRVRGRVEAGFFNDFPYRKVFQVNIPFLEQQTGLNFSWRGVNQVTVPEGKKLVEMIKGIGNAADAKEAAKRGRAIRGARLVQPTEQDLQTDNFVLNIILP